MPILQDRVFLVTAFSLMSGASRMLVAIVSTSWSESSKRISSSISAVGVSWLVLLVGDKYLRRF